MNTKAHHRAMPLLVACAGIATFAMMDVMMKGLSIAMGAYNAMLWRTGLALLIAAALFLGRRKTWPTGAAIKVHVWRGLVISLMAFLFFWGLVYVPIAEAIALTFIAPLIALYLSAVMLSAVMYAYKLILQRRQALMATGSGRGPVEHVETTAV